MAKAKKTETKSAAKHAEKPKAAGTQAFNPANMAAAAAAVVGHRAATAPPENATKIESAGFRNLKESLNRTHSQTMGGLLDKIGSTNQKKGGPSHGGGVGPVGHNQTYGSDASRKNVPRRTAG